MEGGKRIVYFETSREGVEDREGEDIAADALWNSRGLFLTQGDLDISHWSKLGNPVGSGARPEYIIGAPVDVVREGPSIFVKGEIFNPRSAPPENSQGASANMFWHSLTEQDPPGRWFPSVFGFIREDGVKRGEGAVLNGAIDWTSVGFAQRAQHPELPAIGTLPVGPFAKAGTLQMSYATFAKAVQTAGDASALDAQSVQTGVPAIRSESLQPTPKKPDRYTDLYKRARAQVLTQLASGDIPATLDGVADAFAACGVPKPLVYEFAQRLDASARKL